MRQVRYRQTTRGYLCHNGMRGQRVGTDEYGMLDGIVLVLDWRYSTPYSVTTSTGTASTSTLEHRQPEPQLSYLRIPPYFL